jgi:hypothetical protein
MGVKKLFKASTLTRTLTFNMSSDFSSTDLYAAIDDLDKGIGDGQISRKRPRESFDLPPLPTTPITDPAVAVAAAATAKPPRKKKKEKGKGKQTDEASPATPGTFLSFHSSDLFLMSTISRGYQNSVTPHQC